MSDGQLFVAVWAVVMVAETGAALAWRHHQKRRTERHYLEGVAIVRTIPPASGQRRRVS